ncbi:MAG: hypothetical protein KGL53_09085, partial [Elusimicrobia bacterium]|nr:hypothetical protein [Elusimicrobiota bacterium]
AFASFLAAAPYGQREKDLLSFIAANLPEPQRSEAFGVLMEERPQVVVDSQHAGSGARCAVGTLQQPGLPALTLVAVNDGAVLIEKRALFHAEKAWELPDAESFYERRGLKRPAAQAFDRTNGSSASQKTDWGDAKAYPDGSLRLERPQAALAGALVRGLLLLDARARLPGDPYSAALLAWTGEFRLYQALEKSGGREPDLDPDQLALYREWRDRPFDFVDTAAQSLLARGDAAARILSEAGAGAAAAQAPEPMSLPVDGSAAQQAWLDAEAQARGYKK